MAEQVTLSTAIDPPLTVFRIAVLMFDWANAHITVQLRDWSGTTFGDRLVVAHYTGPEATTLMQQLNIANLTTQSLHQRVMARLLADGKIPSGTTSGTPS
jgi:hypothetical protein